MTWPATATRIPAPRPPVGDTWLVQPAPTYDRVLATPDPADVALGTLRGIHQSMDIHMDVHGNQCGPGCPVFVEMFCEAGYVLAALKQVT